MDHALVRLKIEYMMISGNLEIYHTAQFRFLHWMCRGIMSSV